MPAEYVGLLISEYVNLNISRLVLCLGYPLFICYHGKKSQFVTKCYTGPVSCEHGNEPSGLVKSGEFLD